MTENKDLNTNKWLVLNICDKVQNYSIIYLWNISSSTTHHIYTGTWLFCPFQRCAGICIHRTSRMCDWLLLFHKGGNSFNMWGVFEKAPACHLDSPSHTDAHLWKVYFLGVATWLSVASPHLSRAAAANRQWLWLNFFHSLSSSLTQSFLSHSLPQSIYLLLSLSWASSE